MPDLTFKLSDLWLAMNGRGGAGIGPLVTLQDREGIPGVATYVLAKIRRKAVGELEDMEKARVSICEDLAAKDEDGKPKKLENGSYDIPDLNAFAERFNALLQQDVTLTGVRKLRQSEFGTANITVGEWDALAPFLEDDTEQAA